MSYPPPPGDDRPSLPAYGEPAADPLSSGQPGPPVDPTPGHPTPGHPTPAYPVPGYGPAGYGPAGYGPTDYGQAGYGPAGYGQAGYQTAGHPASGFPGPGYPPGPAGYPPGHVAPYGYGYGHPPRVNGTAIASLVVSCTAVAGLCAYGLGGLLGIVGAILGHIGRRQARRNGEGGQGMALAGIIVGWACTAVAVVVITLLVLLFWSVAQEPTSEPTPFTTF